MPPDPPSRRATRALIAYWNPPFENSRSATGPYTEAIDILIKSQILTLPHYTSASTGGSGATVHNNNRRI